MTSQELREKFIKFFESKGHKHLPSSSLIPDDDPSVLLTTAGMQQFKKWFSGVKKPKYPRVVTLQKCVRIGDIEEVGDSTHLSFFEMAGNFSFSSASASEQAQPYFKKEAIEWGIEFIQDELGISFDRISFTYFLGDREIKTDEESLKIFRDLKVPENKIKGMGREDNFWGPTGDEGPCGPTVEIYVDGVEVWNLVFNEYYRTREGKYEPLKTPGVDTGLGFERMLAILEKKNNFYDTEPFSGIISKIKELTKEEDQTSFRIIADHLRAAIFLLADGVLPSNLGEGYVLRRLIRRAIRYGRILGVEEDFTSKIAKVVINNYNKAYPELEKNREKIIEGLNKEEHKFFLTIEKGMKVFEKRKGGFGAAAFGKAPFSGIEKVITGKEAFDLFQTYGFPLEITQEIAKEKGFKVDKKGFEEEFKKHQKFSRKGAEKKFKGGLATGGEQETKYHTATHLLHQALRTILGDHVKQAGSNITSERLRFDFTHPEKLTPEQIEEVENLVNEQIKAKLPVKCEEMSIEEAQKQGAIGLFEAKYGDKVKVYSIGPSTSSGQVFSKEICGGPHVKNTGELGHFKIIKEEASSAGVRRIKAVLE